MNETMKTLTGRRSVRKYKTDRVPEKLLDEVLRAGVYAPTGMNRQGVKLVAVTDSALIRELSQLNAAVLGTDGDPFYGAPCVIIVFSDTNYFTYIEDGSLALGNMLNAACSLGLGSCWIHRAKEVFEGERGKALMKEWGIPASYAGIGNCIIGYTDEPVLFDKPRTPDRIIKI